MENGSYLKQLMTNLDKSPFGILNKKSFLFSEASGAGFILEPIQVCNGGVKVSSSMTGLPPWQVSLTSKNGVLKVILREQMGVTDRVWSDFLTHPHYG